MADPVVGPSRGTPSRRTRVSRIVRVMPEYGRAPDRGASSRSLALHELDPRHRSAVALARPELQDRMYPPCRSRSVAHLVEQLRHHVAVGDVAEDLAARRRSPRLRT